MGPPSIIGKKGDKMLQEGPIHDFKTCMMDLCLFIQPNK